MMLTDTSTPQAVNWWRHCTVDQSRAISTTLTSRSPAVSMTTNHTCRLTLSSVTLRLVYLYYRASACTARRARYCFTTVDQFVRLSVGPMPVLCLNEYTHSHTFWHSDRGIVLVFEPRQCYIPWVGKILRFCDSRKRHEIGPWLIWIINRKS